MSVPHPHTSAFVKHFLHQHPHLPTQLSAHLRDDPEGFNAVVGEWHEASRDGHHSDEPFDVSHADSRRLLAMAMVDAEMEAQASGEPLSDEVRENYRSLADDGHMAAVLGMHPEDPIQKAWDSKSHPRSDDGRFIKKGDIEAAKGDPEKAKALLARTTKPAERAKLEKVLGGETAPGQSKGDDRKQATREKKEKVQASRSRAAELAAKATRGDATREELAELTDHLPALNVKQLRQVRAALYAKLGGVTRRDEILAKIKDHAKGMAEGDTQHARKQDEAAQERKVRKAEREAKRKKLRAQIRHYGYLNPDDSEFQAHFGSMSSAVKEWGLNVGLFRKGGEGFDHIADRMSRDGHFTVPDGQNATNALWEKLTEDADSMLADRKDEVAEAQEAYHKELAAVAAEQGITHEYGQDLTADDLFGDDEQSATAYRDAEASVAEAVASDPFGAGGGSTPDPWDEPEPASEVTPAVSEKQAEKPDTDQEPVSQKQEFSDAGKQAETGKQPHEMTREEFETNTPKGYAYKPSEGENIARYLPDGRVLLTDSFFDHSPEDRKQILAHEHGHGAVNALTKDPDQFWPLVNSGLLGHYDEQAGKFVGRTKRQRNADEVLSDAVADYHLDPDALKQKHPAIHEIARTIVGGEPITPSIIERARNADKTSTQPVNGPSGGVRGSDAASGGDRGSRAGDGGLEHLGLREKVQPPVAGGSADGGVRGLDDVPNRQGAKEKEATKGGDGKPVVKPVVATRPLVKPKPKADAPREKTEAELEREQRADIDAKVAEDKRQKKLAAGGEDTPDDFAPLPETGGKATLADPKQPNLAGDDPYADDKFHGTVAESFGGDTPAERFKTAQSASEGKRKAAAMDAGMTLAEFDAELAKRMAPPAKEPSRDEQLAALLKEQEDDDAPKKKKKKTAKKEAGAKPVADTPKVPAKFDSPDAMEAVFDKVKGEKFADKGRVPIHELRAEVRKQFGDEAASPAKFDETLHDLRRAGKLRLIPSDSVAGQRHPSWDKISDAPTPEQIKDSIPSPVGVLTHAEWVGSGHDENGQPIPKPSHGPSKPQAASVSDR